MNAVTDIIKPYLHRIEMQFARNIIASSLTALIKNINKRNMTSFSNPRALHAETKVNQAGESQVPTSFTKRREALTVKRLRPAFLGKELQRYQVGNQGPSIIY